MDKIKLWLRLKRYTINLWVSFISSLTTKKFSCSDALEDYKDKRTKYHMKNG